LRFGEGANVFLRGAHCGLQRGSSGVPRELHLFRRDEQRRIRLQAVEPGGVAAQGRVAALPDIGEDAAHDWPDLRGIERAAFFDCLDQRGGGLFGPTKCTHELHLIFLRT
jgi:hypothetical protein